MKNTDKIEEEIAKTLASFEGSQRATPKPFFYTRLEANLQQRYTSMPKFVPNPTFIWSFLALIVILNISVVIRYSQNNKASEEQNANTFAQEYGLSSLDTNL